MNRLKNAVIWYARGGLFHPFYIFLSVLPTILLLPYRNDPMFDNYFMLYVDLTVIPLVALMAALHIVREPQVTIFEISLLKSLRVIYTAKLVAYLIALSLGFIPLMLLLSFVGKTEVFLIPLICRMLTYVAIVSISFLLETPKNVLVYLLVFFLLLPYASPVLLNNARMSGSKLDPVTSIISYFIAPIASSLYNDALGLSTQILQFVVVLISIVVVVLNYLIYSMKEFAI